MADLGLGGQLAKKNVSPTFAFLAMAYEWRHLSQDVQNLKKGVKDRKKDSANHDIEKIEKDMVSIDEKIKDADSHGYKLGYRNFLLLRMSVNKLRVLVRMAQESLQEDEVAMKHLLAKTKDATSTKKLQKLLKGAEWLDSFVTERFQTIMNEFRAELKSDRKALLGFSVEMEGKTAVSLAFKASPESLLQMTILRFGAISKLRREVKGEGEDFDKIEAFFKKRDGPRKSIVANVHSLEKTDKDAIKHAQEKKRDMLLRLRNELYEQETKLEKTVKNEFTELFDHVENVIKHTYKIFMYDILLLRAVVDILYDEQKVDEQLMLDHFIPETMGMKNMEELKKNKASIKGHADNLQKFILQLLNS
ncbi:MAG: hypothetical protein O2779_02525 [Nanoarchaeota archaeon]|nr:hypothetical protein [Nanoarchaeota archaeon]